MSWFLRPFPAGMLGTGRPGVPVLTVVMVGTTAHLSWTAASGAQGYRVWRELGKRAGAGFEARVQVGPALSPLVLELVDAGLLHDSEYRYTVEAYNSAGSTESVPVEAYTVPLPPLAPRVVQPAISTASLDLAWDEDRIDYLASSGGGYRLYRQGQAMHFAELDLVLAHQVTGLQHNTEYCFEITAFNDAGESGRSAPFCGKTREAAAATPGNRTVTDQSVCNGGTPEVRIRLAWTNGNGADSTWQTRIRRTHALDGSVVWTQSSTLQEFIDTSALPGATYTYEVQHFKAGVGESAWGSFGSIRVAADTCPVAPTLAVTSNPSDGGSYCSVDGDVWRNVVTVATGGVPPGWTLRVEWGTNGSTYPNLLYAGGSGGTIFHTRTRAAVTHYRARFEKGVSTTEWRTLMHTTWSLYVCPPPAPSNVRIVDLSTCVPATNLTQTAARLEWNPVGPGIDEQRIYTAEGVLVEILPGNASQWTIPSTPGVGGSVSYRVAQYRDGQESTTRPLASHTFVEKCPVVLRPASMAAEDRSYIQGGVRVLRQRVSWVNGTSAPGYVTVLQRRVGLIGEWEDQSTTYPIPINSADVPLAAGGTYYWRAYHWNPGTGHVTDPVPVTPASATTNLGTIAVPWDLHGVDSSFCEISTTTRRQHRLYVPTPPAGWSVEIQGEYVTPGRWASPNHGVYGTTCPSTNENTSWVLAPGDPALVFVGNSPHVAVPGENYSYVDVRRCVVAYGSFNTYRMRWRRANLNNPDGYDTSEWGVPHGEYLHPDRFTNPDYDRAFRVQTTIENACQLPAPEFFTGSDESICQVGNVPLWRHLLRWQQSIPAGCEIQIQGQYNFVGNWLNPTNGQPGYYASTTHFGSVYATHLIQTQLGFANDYRARFYNPVTGQTSDWTLLAVVSEGNPCGAG